MRTCPRCHNMVFDGMNQCFECMYIFAKPEAQQVTQFNVQENEQMENQQLQDRHCGIDGDATIVEYKPSYTLQVIHKNGESENFSLGTSGLRIGRSSDCDIVLSDPTVSRDHLRLYLLDHKVLAEDRNAANPSMIDQIPLKGCVEIEVGQVIEVRGVNLILKSS